MIRAFLGLLTVLVATLPAVADQEQLPDGAPLKLARLEAFPDRVQLTTPYAYRQLLVTAELVDGRRIDVTRIADVNIPSTLVKISENGLIRPTNDGSGTLTISLAGQRLSIPVQVSGQNDPFEVSYVRDVNPAMSKMGCNAGTCHGAAQGKNGFQLSLRGYDPIFDHRALTDDLSGRRFDRAAPSRSLMLLKATAEVPHVGGMLTRPDEPYYKLIHDWIGQGVKLDLGSPRVTGIEVFPKDPIVPDIGMKQQMAVLATYSDGSQRDVTAEAFVETSDGEIAKVDGTGLVSTIRRGEATMLARYEGAYAASTVVVMGDRSGFTWEQQPVHNWIDELVDQKLRRIKVQSSGLCSDAEFIRRIYLDLTGLPPAPETVRAFLTDQRSSQVKREELIDQLVGNPEYVDHWTNKWADLLQVNRKFLGVEGAKALREHVHKSVASNQPYNEFCYEIMTASGSTVVNPPAGYYKVLRTPEDVMENTTQLFLAIRFNCNKCHDHPFERWTQDQYYELAAFFTQVGRQEDPKYKGQKLGGTAVEKPLPAVEIISDTNKGEIKHERTGEISKPAFPFTFESSLTPPDADASRRERLARWATSPENPYFAKSYVNRVWSYLLGVGLIEPVDDIRASNPPSNPELLDRLTREFIEHGFDAQWLVKTICKSRTYQLSIETNEWNEGDTANYSHAMARRLPAEVLYDAIHRATGSSPRLPGLPAGARAAQLLDSNVDLPGGFLDLFGKPARESACECERGESLMLGPILAMVNGPVLADAVRDPNNRIAKLAETITDDDQLIEELFLAVLNRYPTESEIEASRETLHGAKPDFEALIAEHRRRVETFETYQTEVDRRQPAWEQRLSQEPSWSPLAVAKAESQVGAKLEVRPDRSIFVSGKNGHPELYTLTVPAEPGRVTAVRLEALPDDKLPAKGPGRAQNGNFVLNQFRVFLVDPANPDQAKPIELHKAQATFSQDSWAVAGAIDGNNASGWAVSPKFGQAHSALFEFKSPLDLQAGQELRFELDQRYQGKDHNLGRFRLSLTADEKPLLTDGIDPKLRALLKIPTEERTPQQQAELTRRHREEDARYRQLRAEASDVPPKDHRTVGAQDLTWALMNSPAFLFNY